jgi:hypothetical protein
MSLGRERFCAGGRGWRGLRHQSVRHKHLAADYRRRVERGRERERARALASERAIEREMIHWVAANVAAATPVHSEEATH